MGFEQPIIDGEVEGPIRHKLTVEEFLILDEAGVFPSKYTELIDGEIFDLSPTFAPHARTQHLIAFEFELAVRRLSGAFLCYAPVSTEIDRFNLPFPDLVVADDHGGDRFMSPASVRLVVEVSSSTLRHDLVKKVALYARAGIPEYWVVDVKGRRVVRMHGLVEGAYRERAEFVFGGSVASATIPGLVVDTAPL